MKKKIIFAALAVVVGLSLCGLVYCWYNSALQVMLVNVSGKEMCCKISVCEIRLFAKRQSSLVAPKS